jgi:hypothetical protein
MESLPDEAMAALVSLYECRFDEVEECDFDEDDIAQITDHMYTANGNWAMMYEEEESYPVIPGAYAPSAEFASMALYKALGEAQGNRINPFESLGNFRQLGTALLS